MATGRSGSIALTVSSTNGITGRIAWSETYDADKNTSSVTARLLFSKSNTGISTYSNAFKFYLTINGKRKDVTVSHTFPASGQADWEATTFTVSGISHNTDGSKSITISGGGGDSTTSGLKSSSGSGTAVLTTIQRAATITSVSDIIAGNNTTIKWTPRSSSHTFKIELYIGGAMIKFQSGISPARTTEYTYTGIGVSVGEITTAMSKTVTARLYTYSGGTQVGSYSEKKFNVSVPEYDLTLPGVATSISNESPLENVNEKVQGYTKIVFSVSGANAVESVAGSAIKRFEISGAYQASISTVTDLGGGRYGFTHTMRFPFNAQYGTCYVKAIDNRGIESNTVTVNLGTFYSYEPPWASTYSISRAVYTNPSTQEKSLSSLSVIVNYSISTVNGKVSLASGYPKIYLKESSSPNWGSPIQENVVSGREYTFANAVNELKIYNVKVEILDTVGGTQTVPGTIRTIQALVHTRPENKGLCIGGMSTQDRFEVQMQSSFSQAMTVNGTLFAMGGLWVRDGTCSIDVDLLVLNGKSIEGWISDETAGKFLLLSGGTLSGAVNIKTGSTGSSSGFNVRDSSDNLFANIYRNASRGFLRAGNDIATTSSGGADGQITLYGTGTAYTAVQTDVTSTNRTVHFPNAAGTISVSSSSRIVKENIKDMTDEEAEKLFELRPVTFDYIDGFRENRFNNTGLIAEEVVDLFPGAVDIPDGYDEETCNPLEDAVPSIDYGSLVAPLIKIIQRQEARIKALEDALGKMT